MTDLKYQQKRLLAHRCEYLAQQRASLHEIVDNFVEEIKSSEEIWMNGLSENCASFQDLSQMMDSAALVLSQTSAELSEKFQQIKMKLQNSSSEPTISFQPSYEVNAKENLVSDLSIRIEAIEKSLESLQEGRDRIGEIELKVGHLSTKQDDTEDKIKELHSKQAESVEEILERSRRAENELMNFVAQQDELRAQVDSLAEKLNDTKEIIHSTSAKSEEEMEQLSARCRDDKNNILTEVDKLKKQFEELSEAVDEMKELSTKHQELEEKVSRMCSEQNELNERVDELSAKLIEQDDKLEDTNVSVQEVNRRWTQMLNQTSQEVKNVSREVYQTSQRLKLVSQKTDAFDELSAKVLKAEKELQELDGVDKYKIAQLEKKIGDLDRKNSQDIQSVSKDVRQTKQKYDMMRTIVNNRLVSLEQLRDILNKKIQGKEVKELSCENDHAVEDQATNSKQLAL